MKRLCAAILSICILLTFSACSVEKIGTEKIRDIDFTVIKEEDIPEELKTKINDNEKQVFKLTYADQGALYIAEGYGE